MTDNKQEKKRQIEMMIEAGAYDEALAMLDRAIEEHQRDSALWYQRGRLYWRLGKKGEAISDYEEALHLDADSPARHALEVARKVMDYFNPDLLNP